VSESEFPQPLSLLSDGFGAYGERDRDRILSGRTLVRLAPIRRGKEDKIVNLTGCNHHAGTSPARESQRRNADGLRSDPWSSGERMRSDRLDS
jgi:hypothetical protein